jgi:hypothetical protein
MASTRNKNTPGNYNLEQKQNIKNEDWQLYMYGANGYAYDTKLAGNGLNPGQVPWDMLSNNAPDIESFLFGINSTNLVNPSPCLNPSLRTLHSADLFDKKPIIMPVPQAVTKNQRPFPV